MHLGLKKNLYLTRFVVIDKRCCHLVFVIFILLFFFIQFPLDMQFIFQLKKNQSSASGQSIIYASIVALYLSFGVAEMWLRSFRWWLHYMYIIMCPRFSKCERCQAASDFYLDQDETHIIKVMILWENWFCLCRSSRSSRLRSLVW